MNTRVDPFSVLLLCGSLRVASLNRLLLRCFAARAPAAHRCRIDLSLGSLPLFNADEDRDDRQHLPTPVATFRTDVIASDALVIASPEYAHGVSGVLKNGLDWLVSVEGFVAKPVLLLDYSPRSIHATASLIEILATMSARIVGERSHPIPVRGRGLDDAGVLADASLVAALDSAHHALAEALSAPRP